MRINAGIPVECLSDEHLRAEELEIAMLPGFFNKVWKGKSAIPSQFTLGQGHISFFMNKKTWTLRRYKELHEECIKRGFTGIKDKSERWNGWIPKDNIDWVPTDIDNQIIKERIISKLNNSTGTFHYYRKRIEKGDLIDLLF